MNTRFITKVALIAGAAIFLNACSSGSPSDADNGQNQNEESPAVGSPIVQSSFAFPAVELAAGDSVGTVARPEGVLPVFSARRTLTEGAGDVVQFGDPVQLKYNMYSWTSGELVETSDSFDDAIIIDAGVASGVPAYLSSSVLGRKKGETVQIVYKAGLEDLPSYLDNEDAYVMVLQVL